MKRLVLTAHDLRGLRFPRTNTIEAQKAEIASLTTSLATATSERDTARTERDNARAELATANTSLSSVTIERDNARTELATSNQTIAARDQEITRLKNEAVTVERKAQQLLAAQGHQPIALGADINTLTDGKNKSLIEQYNAISDSGERAKFYAKHKDKL